jgi:hypothetical protein
MVYLKTILYITFVMSFLASIAYVSNPVHSIPSDLSTSKHAFGPLIGVTLNESGNVDWLLSGNWRSILTNDANGNNTQFNQSTGAFRAAIEMIKPDGTARHTHALTDFEVTKTDQHSNATTFNGTSTISMANGPAVDIPTAIQRSDNGNVFKIMIDPKSVDYHFGNWSIMYGISANHEMLNQSNPEG